VIPHATLERLSRHAWISITDDISVSDALAVVRAHRVHHLPVTRGNDLVGILCSCDLHAALPETPVNAIMRRPVVALDHNASLLDAVSRMNAHGIGSVALMDETRACAVLTRADVLLAQPELAPLFVDGEPRPQAPAHASITIS
jgi:predicted transcriptional regulator